MPPTRTPKGCENQADGSQRIWANAGQSRQASASSRARHCDDDAGYWSHDDRRTGTGLRRVSGSLLRPGVSGPRCWNAPGAASYSWQTGWLDHACSGHLQLVPPSLYHGYFAMEPLVGGMLALEG